MEEHPRGGKFSWNDASTAEDPQQDIVSTGMFHPPRRAKVAEFGGFTPSLAGASLPARPQADFALPLPTATRGVALSLR
ncbi:MAG: hypothetical protein KDA45_14445, partial [Planctomycetales bacterium]|nr:hypothetical protein [Planctomycetales bacterium]